MRPLLLLLVLSISASVSTAQTQAESIVGRWNMDKIVMDGDNDVTAEHNPSENRYIVFNKDGTFQSGGDPYGENTGKWTLNAENKELYLDSDAGEDDDSYWIMKINGDEMHWQGARFEFSKRFQIFHVRGK